MRALYLLYLFLIISVVRGVSVVDKTGDYNDRYADYYAEAGSQCNFQFVLLISDPMYDYSISTMSVGSDSVSPQYTVVSKSPTSTLYNIVLTAESDGNNKSVEFTFIETTSIQPNHVYSTFIKCEDPPAISQFSLFKNQLSYDYSLEGPQALLTFSIGSFKKRYAPPLTISIKSNSFYQAQTPPYAINGTTYLAALSFSYTNISTWFNSIDIDVLFSHRTSISHSFTINSFDSGIRNEAKNISKTTPPSDPVTMDNAYKSFTFLYDIQFPLNQNTFTLFYSNTGKLYKPLLVMGNLTASTFYIKIAPDDSFSMFIDSGVKDTNPITVGYYIEYQKLDSPSLGTLQGMLQLLYFSNSTLPLKVHYKYSDTTPGKEFSLPYPYGFCSGNSSYHLRCLETYLNDYGGSSYFMTAILGQGASSINGPMMTKIVDKIPPQITSIKWVPIPKSPYFIVTMRIVDAGSGFYSIFPYGNISNLISGNLNDGVYEFYLNPSEALFSVIYEICDYARNCIIHQISDYFNTDLDMFPYNTIKLVEIKSVSFQYNDIDVSNSDFNNTMYIETYSKDSTKSYHISVVTINILFNSIKNIYQSQWSPINQRYEIPINIPKNYVTGNLPYIIQSDVILHSGNVEALFGPNSQLRVKSSNGDIIGPIIESFTKSNPNGISIGPGGGYISWSIKISDKVNGFKKGSISIKSSRDLLVLIYNFTTLDSDGNTLISYPINPNCQSQSYYISNVYLEDNQGYGSVYEENVFIQNSNGFNPMIKFYNVTSLSMMNTICTNGLLDNDPPILNSFYFDTTPIDVFSSGSDTVPNPRNLVVKFETRDANGILLTSLPKVYIQDQNYNTLEFDSVLEGSTTVSANYHCNVLIPMGFGYPNGIKFSIFGIIDNQSNFRGYTTTGLNQLSCPHTLYVTSSLNSNSSISILSTSTLYSRDTEFVIQGKQFLSGDLIEFKYDNGTIDIFPPSLIKSSIIYVPISKTITSTVVKVSIKRLSPPLYSNSLDVPVVNLDPTSSSSDDEVLPTNPPQQCLNQCSGNGQCTNSGCVCTSPWIGLDCSSKIIAIDPPKLNNTNPGAHITIPKDQAVFYAVISIAAVNELDNDGNIVYNYPFTQWIASNSTNSKYSQYTSTSYFYTANITNKHDQSTTHLNVSIDYFNVEQPVNITFANQILTMNPYSLKYSVNISQYSFSSSLNTLQIVLSASLESQDNNECSSVQTGNTVESESEFIKMQVNDHSLYSRFIKRGIVDGRVRAVTNTPLNTEFKSTSSKSQTHIGIDVPHYQKLVQLDPDFSVLIENRAVSKSDQNSICTSKSSSKLSAGQIAGIVVGGVVFLFIVAALIVYLLSRKGTSPIAVKLRNMM